MLEPKCIRVMSQESRKQLGADVATHGVAAAGLTRQQIMDQLLLPRNRAERLHAWVHTKGSLSPLPRGPGEVELVEARPTGGKTHLVIGDCHAQPGQDLSRFELLGRMISAVNPDEVVSVGDWYSMDSLCKHRSTAERSKDRTVEELEAGEMALSLVEANLRPGLRCRKTLRLGNHDDRVRQLAGEAPWLEGMYNVGAAHEARGWEVHGFSDEPTDIDGVLYAHYLTAANTGRPISGKFHALRMLERVLFQRSVVVGHSHLFQHYIATFGKKRIHGVVSGCFMDHIESYAGISNHEWWRGILVLRNVVDGDFDLEMWSMDRIRATFG